MRRLFVDLDETLIHTREADGFDRTRKYRKDFPEPEDLLVFRDEKRYLWFRPDWPLLIGYPFSIFTSASNDYAFKVARLLSEMGLNIEAVYSRDDIESGHETETPIDSGNSFLIDDLPHGSSGIKDKMSLLPRGIHCQIAPFTPGYMSPGNDLATCMAMFARSQ